ncbi:uncharacterized protein LOC122804449 isoform X2 [Protopterus annectens]|uniref:uncharacterized protein LOC122804449 isoform X2 n=1 Tax=Protopterus annectens TaxID=7888 RepID=UPI001CF9CB73|nr:uncharacterized protein LOC122804449 isoform X2 [Protopterus annectens]
MSSTHTNTEDQVFLMSDLGNTELPLKTEEQGTTDMCEKSEVESFHSFEEVRKAISEFEENTKSNFIVVEQNKHFSNENASIMLCDFHREKAWTEWVAKKDHGVHNFRKNILGMLRSIAHAATTEDLHTALTALKKSQCWKTGEAFRQWFSTKWLPAIKMWAHVYRSGTEHIGVNTNNGLERQYETLKYSYLDGYKNCTLSELLTVLHSTFFPNAYKK